jgi:hypothetical protein
MNTEQRLLEAFAEAHTFEPSPDLWDRLVHSIEEDRLHRRRVLRSFLATIGVLVGAALVASLNLQDGTGVYRLPATRIDWRVLEGLEAVTLTLLALVVAPAIRRFGRGYVEDILYSSPGSGTRLLNLLDTAYYLLLAGFILMTTQLSPGPAYRLFHLGGQVGDAATRIGQMLLIIGVLHASTLMVLPLVGLVFNANRIGAKLPRWITLTVLFLALQLLGVVALAAIGGLGPDG